MKTNYNVCSSAAALGLLGWRVALYLHSRELCMSCLLEQVKCQEASKGAFGLADRFTRLSSLRTSMYMARVDVDIDIF